MLRKKESKVWLAFAVGMLALGFLIAVPFFAGGFYLQVLVFGCLFIVLAASYDIVVGHLGLLSLGHPLFFGVGAYTSAMLTMHLHVPWLLALLIAGGLATFVSLITGLIALRATYHAFGLITLAFAYIAYYGVYNWMLLGGPNGISNVPDPSVGTLVLSSLTSQYYIGLIFVFLSLFMIHCILNSRVGRAFHAICDNETLAKAMGINPNAYKILGFSFGAFFAGIAGSYYAHMMNYIGPDAFGFSWTVKLLIMVLAGGSRSFGGVIIGAIVFSILPDVLRMGGKLRMLLFGIILFLVLVYLPRGLGYYVLRGIRKLRGLSSAKN